VRPQSSGRKLDRRLARRLAATVSTTFRREPSRFPRVSFASRESFSTTAKLCTVPSDVLLHGGGDFGVDDGRARRRTSRWRALTTWPALRERALRDT
jgi:hypothetical protein